MVTFRRLETPYYLVSAFADLTMGQNKLVARYPDGQYTYFHHNFSLIATNGAILEGMLKSLLSWRLMEIAEEAVENGLAAGQTGPSFAEHVLAKFRFTVETDAWTQLQNHYATVFGMKFSSLASNSCMESLNHLMKLRNITAHGSPIQLANEELEADDDHFFYQLQQKYKAVSNYLVDKYGKDDLWDVLGNDNQVVKDFWLATQELARGIIALANGEELPAPLQKLLDAIIDYDWGYMRAV